MINIRNSSERGHHQEDWLNSYHTFSFHTYYDPDNMGFRNLRVINEDRIAPSRGFGMHPHENMEIISLVFEGTLEHRDNLGNREIIGPYQLQRITAGTGMTHSEVNPLPDKPVHFLQIWILPKRQNLEPSYQIKKLTKRPANKLTLLVSPDGREGSATLQQDVLLYLGNLQPGKTLNYSIHSGRHAWLQIVSGSLHCNGHILKSGDGAAISDVSDLEIRGQERAEYLLFDLN